MMYPVMADAQLGRHCKENQMILSRLCLPTHYNDVKLFPLDCSQTKSSNFYLPTHYNDVKLFPLDRSQTISSNSY